MKIAIVQRAIKGYRLPVYHQLKKNADVVFFFGDDIKNTKTKSTIPSDISAIKSKTKHINLFGRYITIHFELIKNLKDFKPDVILAEGESFFLGAFLCKIYQITSAPTVPIMKWCFIDLPGDERKGLRFVLKFVFQRLFDTFVLYSNFSKNCLKRYGISENRGFVAVNVGDTSRNLSLYKKYAKNNEKSSAKHVNITYVGNFEKQKKFERFLTLALSLSDFTHIHFIVAGDGDKKSFFIEHCAKLGIKNITFLGHVDNIHEVYLKSDLIYLPGRGGMIISEAMAFGCPVILHEADGTEFNLISNDLTGYIIKYDPDTLKKLVLSLSQDKTKRKKLGANSQRLIREHYNTENMASKILEAANYGIQLRAK